MTKSKKAIFGMLSMLLVAAVAVAGVVMWLTDKTETIQNTFTVGDIEITLGETTGSEYKMTPGNEIAKNPKATVLAESENAWLFVEVEESANFDTYMTYRFAAGWTILEQTETGAVIYREVNASDADQAFDILDGNKVVVKGDVTAETLEQAENNKPTLSFTAYAIQRDGKNFTTADAAWAEVSKPAATA